MCIRDRYFLTTEVQMHQLSISTHQIGHHLADLFCILFYWLSVANCRLGRTCHSHKKRFKIFSSVLKMCIQECVVFVIRALYFVGSKVSGATCRNLLVPLLKLSVWRVNKPWKAAKSSASKMVCFNSALSFLFPLFASFTKYSSSWLFWDIG